MSFSKIYLILSCSTLLGLSCLNPNSQKNIIEKVQKASGGFDAFQNSQFLEFTFEVVKENKIVGSRNHLWDKYSGNYRLEYELNEDSLITVLFNVNSQLGSTFINKQKIQNDSLSKFYLDDAYETYINDTYWLLSPLKLLDSGVRVKLLADSSINGNTVKILHLDFDNGIGITDKDEYWLYVDKNSFEIIAWKYDLEGRKGKPRTYLWSKYKDLGAGVKLPIEKISEDGKVKIHFPVAKFSQSMDSTRFILP